MHKNVLNAISLIGIGDNSKNNKPQSVFNYDDNITKTYANLQQRNRRQEKFHKLFAGIFYTLIFSFLLLTGVQRYPNMLYAINEVTNTIYNPMFNSQQNANIVNIKAQAKNANSALTLDNSFLLATQILELINNRRQQQGLKPLTFSSYLQTSSLIKGFFIFKTQNFNHNLPNLSWQTPFVLAGIPNDINNKPVHIAENLAVGYKQPGKVVKYWLASKTHKQVLLDPNLNAVGISVIHGKLHGLNNAIIVLHEAKLPQEYLDNILYPYTNVYTKNILDLLNASNNNANSRVWDNNSTKNAAPHQTNPMLNSYIALTTQNNLQFLPSLQNKTKQDLLTSYKTLLTVQEFTGQGTNGSPLATSESYQLISYENNTITATNIASQNSAGSILNPTSAKTNSNKIYASSIMQQAENAQSIASKITQLATSPITNILKITIATLALLVSIAYIHTATHDKKKFILIEVIWAFVLVMVGMG